MKVAELTLEEKCKAVGETATIWDRNGKEHNAVTMPISCLNSITFEMPLRNTITHKGLDKNGTKLFEWYEPWVVGCKKEGDLWIGNDGIERSIRHSAFWALSVVTFIEGRTIENLSFTEEGESVNVWRDVDFRGSRGLIQTRINVVSHLIGAGVLRVPDGFLWGLVHPQNVASCKYWESLGEGYELVEKDGEMWRNYKVHVVDFMSGRLAERC